MSTILLIWQSKESVKYEKQLMELEKAYDEENDKTPSDHNLLDHIERDIVRLNTVLNAKVRGSKTVPLQG